MTERHHPIGKNLNAAALSRGEKWCARCQRFKKLRLFPKSPCVPSGRGAWCSKCKWKWAKERKSAAANLNDVSLPERWSSMVDRSPKWQGCWRWTGFICPQWGYGRIWWKGKLSPAHRAAVFAVHGYELARNEVMRNECGNKWCVRPEPKHWAFPRYAYKPKFASPQMAGRRQARDRRIVLEVEQAIPAHLPDEVRDEMRQELALEALTGKSLDRLRLNPRKVSRALKRAWANQPDAFGLSIDVQIGEEGELTFRDALPDGSIFSDPAAIVDAEKRLERALALAE